MCISGISETEAIINRFPIGLVLVLGGNFTQRTTYTGVYNITSVGFDMSFRVQCSDNYFGPNCTTFCEEEQGVYTCDSEGRVTCPNVGQDPATTCSMCFQGWDPATNCTQCLSGRDIDTNCTACFFGLDPAASCTMRPVSDVVLTKYSNTPGD